MVKSMKAKYFKSWDDIDHMNLVLYVAIVLDPQFKLRYVRFCIDTFYGESSKKGKHILEKVG